MSRASVCASAVFLMTLFGFAAAAHSVEPGKAPEQKTPNKNSLIKEFRSKIKMTCSSFWPTWGVERAFDGNSKTSWFSARGDAAALGQKPWIAVEFPQDVTVRRVTLLSNREHPWEIGYTIRVGKVEFLDADGKVLFYYSDELGGEREDMEVRPEKPIEHVRKIRFTSIRDEGDQNPYDDIGLGEIMVE